MLLAGLPGSLFGGAVLDASRDRRYREVLLLLAVGAAAAQSALASLGAAGALVFGAALGFLLCAATSAGFEWGAELSYPAAESTVAGLLNTAAQLGGILLIVATQVVGGTAGHALLACACGGAAPRGSRSLGPVRLESFRPVQGNPPPGSSRLERTSTGSAGTRPTLRTKENRRLGGTAHFGATGQAPRSLSRPSAPTGRARTRARTRRRSPRPS